MKKLKHILLLLLTQIDKVILAISVLSLILALLWLAGSTTSKFYSQQETSKTSSNIKIKKYVPINRGTFNVVKYFSKTPLWQKSIKRNTDKKSPDYIITHTDFM